MDTYIKAILDEITKKLKNVDGVEAVVLGGSHATGSGDSCSDVDIGVYYSGTVGIDVQALDRVCAELDDSKKPGLINKPGEWGKWINGGAWLTIHGKPVDILLRDLDIVRDVIGDCLRGNITIDYQCGHPFGFVSSIYMGEVSHCKTLLERNGRLTELKRLLVPFPPTYKKAAIEKFLWEAEFSMQCAKKSAARGDVIYSAGSVYRCVNCLIYALCAVNHLYLLNEKGALKRLEAEAEWLPDGFSKSMEGALQGLNPENLLTSFKQIGGFIETIKEHVRRRG